MMRLRKTRRKRVKYDMQSVKWCERQLFVRFEEDESSCHDPTVTQFLIMFPDLWALQPALGNNNAVTSLGIGKGLVFGGLTADIVWSYSASEQGANPLNTGIGFATIWEAIHKASVDENGFVTYIPSLSREAVGSDNDVDILWKRVTKLPIWGPANTCGAGPCQLSTNNQNQVDHIRIKSRRRLSEREALVYTTAITGDAALLNSGETVKLICNGWLRVAARQF